MHVHNNYQQLLIFLQRARENSIMAQYHQHCFFHHHGNHQYLSAPYVHMENRSLAYEDVDTGTPAN